MDNISRLKRKHILDLVAYLKTAQKVQRAAVDEDQDECADPLNDLALSDYMENCLFIGLMPEEDGVSNPIL